MFHAIIDGLITPFNYEFVRHAFIAGTIAALLTSMVGFFVVVRQLGFAAHALGHVGFAGASGAILLGWMPIVGQLLITLFAGIMMGSLGRRLEEKDTIIGIILALSLGIGLLFLHFYHGYGGNANGILFGDLLGVSNAALRWMTWLTLLGTLSLGILARPLWFASVNPALAEAKSVPLGILSVLFFCIMSMAITLASQVVGVLLVFALVVGPPAIAMQWTRGFWTGITTSCLLSVFIVCASIFLAYYTDWPISFWISALVFAFYGLGLIVFKNR